jgi:hypothetical protein
MTGPVTGHRVPVEALGAREELGTGGQGRVYTIANNVLNRPYPLVYKEYNAESLDRLEVGALEAMVGAPLEADLVGRLAWPLALVESRGSVTGFLMCRIPRHFYLRVRLRQDRFVPGEVQHFLTDDTILTKRRLAINDKWRLAFLRDTAETIARLHRLDIAVGDLSPKNLLISVTERPSCYFIDCDAMRVAGRSVLPQVETTSWQLPAHETTATSGSDAYKFGLLAIRLAAGDLDTFDPAPLGRISAGLGRLAERATATDPAHRPGFGEWLDALDAAIPSASVRLPWQPVAALVPSSAPPSPRTGWQPPVQPLPGLPARPARASEPWYKNPQHAAMAMILGAVLMLIFVLCLIGMVVNDRQP